MDPATQPQVETPTPPPLVGTDMDADEAVLGRVICEEGSPNMERVQFRILPGRHTAVGRIVGIRHRRPSREPVMTLVRVEEMHEFNPHEDAASSTVSDVIPFETRYAPEGRSTVIYRAAQGELLEEALLNPDGSLNRIESPETLPLSGLSSWSNASALNRLVTIDMWVTALLSWRDSFFTNRRSLGLIVLPQTAHAIGCGFWKNILTFTGQYSPCESSRLAKFHPA